ncbi:unnamed protein product, partial [Rotaria sordida]
MSIVKSSKGHDKLLLEGYSYRRANKSQIIWRCSRNDCAGRITFNDGQYNKITEHVHAPNPEETISAEFKSKITTSATTSHDPPRRIIHEALLNVDKNDGAAVPTYHSSQRTIERKRKRNNIPLPRPQTYAEIVIPDELQVTNAGARFLLYDNQDPNRRLIILSSDDDLDRLSNSEHWHSDSTFKNLGLQRAFVNDTEVRRYLKNFGCLSLIPESHVIAAFEEFQAEAPDSLIDFIDYFENTYVGRIIRGSRRRCPRFSISMWNCFSRLDQQLPRTNNSAEGWNKAIKNCVRQNPSVYECIQELKMEQHATLILGEQLQAGS